VIAYLEQQGESKTNLTPRRIYQCLKTFTSQTLAAFAATEGDKPKKLYHATLGAGDVLVLPTGWFFAERVGRHEDFLGVRIPVVAKASRSHFDEVNNWLLAAAKPSPIVQASLDALLLADAPEPAS